MLPFPLIVIITNVTMLLQRLDCFAAVATVMVATCTTPGVK